MTTGVQRSGDYIARPAVEGERCAHGVPATQACERCSSSRIVMTIDKARALLVQIEDVQTRFREIEDQYLHDNYGAPISIEEISCELVRLHGWAHGELYDLEHPEVRRG